MRLLTALLMFIVFAPPTFGVAADADDPAANHRRDPLFSPIDTEFRTRFSGATLLKVERREKEKREGEAFSWNWGFAGTKNEVLYKLTLSDALNKQFDVVFNTRAELIATEKYRTTVDALPQNVRAAIELKAPNSGGSSDPLDAKLERGVYKVSGKLNGRKINVEVAAAPVAPNLQVAPPAEVVALPPASNSKPPDNPPPEAPQTHSGKPEVAAAVDGPFRAMFRDATLHHVDHKDPKNVTIHVFSIGGGDSRYELTLSDPLNKKFKVVFTETGRLYSATPYVTPFDRLPRAVQAAIEQLTPVTDRGVPLEVRVDHKSLSQTEHEEYKVTGKINDVKINIEVPIYANR